MKKINLLWILPLVFGLLSCKIRGSSCELEEAKAGDDQCYCGGLLWGGEGGGGGGHLPISSNGGHWARVEARLTALGPLLDPQGPKETPMGESCDSPAIAHWTLDVTRIRQNIGSPPSPGELDTLVRQSVGCASADWKSQLDWWTELQQSGVSLDLFLEQEYDQWYVTYIVIPDGISPPTSFTTQYCNYKLSLLPTTSAILEAGLNSALSAPTDAENEELIDRCMEAVQDAGATEYVIRESC